MMRKISAFSGFSFKDTALQRHHVVRETAEFSYMYLLVLEQELASGNPVRPLRELVMRRTCTIAVLISGRELDHT